MSLRLFLFFPIVNRRNLHGVGYPEGEERLAGGRWHVDAPWVRVLAFGRDNSLEGLRKREVDIHVVFSAHHFQGLDGWHAVWSLQWPNVAVATDALQANHLYTFQEYTCTYSPLNPRPSFFFFPLFPTLPSLFSRTVSFFKPLFFRRPVVSCFIVRHARTCLRDFKVTRR